MPAASAPSAKIHLRLRIDARFLEQDERAARPSIRRRRPGHESPERRLRRLLLVEQLAVAAAFDEGNARHHRIARQGLEREDQRALNQAVDQQPMRVRIDVGNAAVMALEMQAVRRDHAVEQVMRRARRRRCRSSRVRCPRSARPCLHIWKAVRSRRTQTPAASSKARPEGAQLRLHGAGAHQPRPRCRRSGTFGDAAGRYLLRPRTRPSSLDACRDARRNSWPSLPPRFSPASRFALRRLVVQDSGRTCEMKACLALACFAPHAAFDRIYKFGGSSSRHDHRLAYACAFAARAGARRSGAGNVPPPSTTCCGCTTRSASMSA